MRCKICQKVVRHPGNSSKVVQTCGKCQKSKSHSVESSAQNIVLNIRLSRLAEECLYYYYNHVEVATIIKESREEMR